jgi:hypothetical protein
VAVQYTEEKKRKEKEKEKALYPREANSDRI